MLAWSEEADLISVWVRHTLGYNLFNNFACANYYKKNVGKCNLTWAMKQYYSAIKGNAFESVLMRWMNLEPIIQSEVKNKYHILMHIYRI